MLVVLPTLIQEELNSDGISYALENNLGYSR